MKRGQTIAVERERVQSASERMQERAKQKRKRSFRLALIIVVGMVVLAGVALLWSQIAAHEQTVDTSSAVQEPQAEMVDEAGLEQIPTSTKTYAALLEQDLADLGYTVTRITLPNGMNRELYIDIEGRSEYYKVNIDRDAAEEAEDVERMMKYLDEKGLTVEYVDVRVEGKAFYK